MVARHKKTSNPSHDTTIHGSRPAERHGHAEGLQAVEGLGRGHAGREIIGNAVERGSDVGVLGARRGLLEGAELILAREIFLLLAGEVDGSIRAIATVMRALVPKEANTLVCVVRYEVC